MFFSCLDWKSWNSVFGANNYMPFLKIQLSKTVLFGIYYQIMVQYLHNDFAVNCVKF